MPEVSAGTLPAMPITGRRSVKAVASSLFALTKPRIIELLLVTTIPTMLLAERGLPSVRILLVTLVGGALAAGSANNEDATALTLRRPVMGIAGRVPAETSGTL